MTPGKASPMLTEENVTAAHMEWLHTGDASTWIICKAFLAAQDRDALAQEIVALLAELTQDSPVWPTTLDMAYARAAVDALLGPEG